MVLVLKIGELGEVREVYFGLEEVFEHDIEYLGVVLLFEVFVCEHVDRADHQQLAVGLQGAATHDRFVFGVAHGSRTQETQGRLLHVDAASVHNDELQSTLFLLSCHLVILVLSDYVLQKLVLLLALFRLVQSQTSQVLVQNPRLNQNLFRVEIFEKVCTHHSIVVQTHVVLFQ